MAQHHTNGNANATEHTPLLKDQPDHATSSSPEQDEGTVQDANPDGDSSVPISEEPSTTRLTIILGSTWFGIFLAALDATIIATISTPITATFKSFSLFSWLASGYLIANAALQPLSGKLTDIFGRRNGLIWANAFFCAGTLICGLATEKWTIIFGRIVAGMGGGCLNTITTFVASDLVPLRRRGLIQGLGNIAFATGSGLGGVFGGWISDVWSWRWAFLIQVPLIALSGVIVFFTIDIPVKETDKSKIKRVDFAGATSLVTTLVLLLLGLNSGGNIVPWNHPLVYVSLALSAIGFLVYVYIEERLASEPIIPLKLMLNRTVSAACLANWFASMAFFGYLYYAPIFFEVQGYSASAAGSRLTPSSVGAAIGSLGAGFMMRATGKYWWLNGFCNCFLVVSGALNVICLDLETPVWQPFVIFGLAGFGYGALITITLLALISAVDHEHQAVITSASYAFRSTGSTIGIAISSAVFQNLLNAELWKHIGYHEGAGDWIDAIRNDLDILKKLPQEWRGEAVRACINALHGVWWTVFAMVTTAALLSLGMREHVLYKSLSRNR